MAENPINIISKIGNYALPAFSAFLTASFAVGNLSWPEGRDRNFLIAFSLYTIISVFISYMHRLCWLRHRNKLESKGEKPEDLSLCTVSLFMLAHVVLICVLTWVIYNYSWL